MTSTLKALANTGKPFQGSSIWLTFPRVEATLGWNWRTPSAFWLKLANAFGNKRGDRGNNAACVETYAAFAETTRRSRKQLALRGTNSACVETYK